MSKGSKNDEAVRMMKRIVYRVQPKPLQYRLGKAVHWQHLFTGLSTTAKIKTEKRRIIEFFITLLIKHLDEYMSIRSWDYPTGCGTFLGESRTT
jgi:hypothetical protein